MTEATSLDRPELLRSVDSILSSPVERAAVALWRMGHHTPEHVGMFAQRSSELLSAWTGPGMREADRSLFRRRALMVLDAHEGIR